MVHIAWEGMGSNAWTFREIAPVLKQIHQKKPIALHLVTDLEYPSHNGPLAWKHSLKKELTGILKGIPFYLYEWNSAMLSTICTQCDIALLPIPQKPPIYWAKPENRLLMLWRMGLPVLTSSTPAHMRCMKAVGINEMYATKEDWGRCLETLIGDEDLRKKTALLGQNYACQAANDQALADKWITVLESVL
ncbi:MAG: hypothetical protein JKY15_04470 [Deltaproteobacteria bacterium]|nr:hypothetical protein [Deltaproteobacteria bacterium]